MTVLVWLGPVGGEVRLPSLPECIHLHLGLPMLPDGAGLCLPPHSQIYTGLEKRFPSNWSCLMKQVPKWNQTVLKKKKKSWEEIYLSRVTHSWKLKGCSCQTKGVDAKEDGQRSAGVAKENVDKNVNPASPGLLLTISWTSASCLPGQVKAKHVWTSLAAMDLRWPPLLVDGHRQAKQRLTDRQI